MIDISSGDLLLAGWHSISQGDYERWTHPRLWFMGTMSFIEATKIHELCPDLDNTNVVHKDEGSDD